MLEMKLEAGKFYKTLDGRKAYVAQTGITFPGSEHGRAIGYVPMKDENGYDPHFWFEDGTASNKPHEILSEWQEPKRIKGWMNIEQSTNCRAIGNVIWPTKEKADSVADPERLACIEIDVLEGQGL